MCFNENSAPHAVHYVNGQLQSLWENATQCAAHQGGNFPAADGHRFSFALAQFYYGKLRSKGIPSKDDFSFFIDLAQPTLEFACNHDVILHLRVNQGHYRLDIDGTSGTTIRCARY